MTNHARVRHKFYTHFKRLVILAHRYIGIPLSLLFIVWFASAFALIYTEDMPRVTPEMRLDRADPLAFSAINLSPLEAASEIGISPSTAGLTTRLGRPVYEFSQFGTPTFVFADNGERFEGIDEQQAVAVASKFLNIPPQQFRYAGLVEEADQWTVGQIRNLPLYKLTADDAEQTEVYVSPSDAQVTLYTTSQSRFLAWIGAIPHWLYFTVLRENQPLWLDVIIWTSVVGCVLAVLGLILVFTQFRKVRPFELKRAIPYRGWMRWHYILGVIFGVTTLTWAFSGLLSVQPFDWVSGQGVSVSRNLYREEPIQLEDYVDVRTINWSTLADGDIKTIAFSRIQGQPYYEVTYSRSASTTAEHDASASSAREGAGRLLVHALDHKVRQSFDPEILIEKLETAAPAAAIVDQALISNYDSYYYSRENALPLPVLRVKFDDPMETWIYIDPAESRLVSMINANSRIQRWLYNGLHSLDFAFWYDKRPLWDIGVIVLLLGGLITSAIGFYLGMRRLKRGIAGFIGKIGVGRT